MSYEALPWDSDFFGMAIGLVPAPRRHEEIELAVSRADQDSVVCLYLLIPMASVEALHWALEAGFLPYDVRVELDIQLEADAEPFPDGVRRATSEDLATLERLARAAFTETRFTADPRFPAERVPELYAAWARRGIETYPERQTFLADRDEGFITCRFEGAGGEGTIELISVVDQAVGTGIGDDLIRTANAAFSRAGMRKAQVATQGRNIAGQRLYQRGGFRSRRLGLWLHRWHPGLAPGLTR